MDMVVPSKFIGCPNRVRVVFLQNNFGQQRGRFVSCPFNLLPVHFMFGYNILKQTFHGKGVYQGQ
jgi:hypothetical protein